MLPRMRANPAILVALAFIAIASAFVLEWTETTPGHEVTIDAATHAEPSFVAPAPASDEVQLVADDHSDHDRRNERPLPAFEGMTIEGKRLSISSLVGKRFVLFFFNPEVDDSRFVATAVSRVAKLRGKNNFEIVGVAMGSNLSTTRRFAKETDLDFPILDDSSGRISKRLGLRQPIAIYGIDSEGYLDYGIGYFSSKVPDPAGVVEEQLRENLRLPSADVGDVGVLDTRPSAPLITVEGMADDETFVLEDSIGKPIVLIFFLHTCPHCHSALSFFREQIEKLPQDKRPVFVGISVQHRPSAVKLALEQRDLDFFPVYFDPEQEAIEKYGVFAGFPDVFLIDREGRIVHRTQGWQADRDPALNRMILARITGNPVPMLLNPKGYTGSDVCSVCHEKEAMSYRFTQHASAFDTLVTHNEIRNGECVSCHVVGFDEPGGYSFKESPKQLENVGCESCHGRGGPHLSPGSGKQTDYEAVCKTCHNPTHSLGFDYATFLPKVSHSMIAALSDEQRAELVVDGAKVRDVLPKNARYVGSNTCRSCHEIEFKTWASGPHRHAVDTLTVKGKADDKDCLQCHTTAMGRPGGFPADGNGKSSPATELGSVGCESCHGPGGDHIAEDAKKIGTIVSLGDKCDSCVILQICGSCHDDANDPGFEFEVDDKIERQRHGTIEPGTGEPLGDSASHPARGSSLRADLAEAFRLADDRG